MSQNRTLLLVLSFLALSLFSARITFGESIGPGSSYDGNPQLLSTSGWTLIASSSQAAGSGSWSDTLLEAVYANGSGELNFLFQVSNTSPSTNSPSSQYLIELTLASFADFQTNVGIVDGSTLSGLPFVSPTGGESEVSRSTDGSTLTIDDNFAGDFISPGGGSSPIIAIETNATTYDSNGNIGLGFVDLQHLGLANPMGFAYGYYPPNTFGSNVGTFEPDGSPYVPPPPPPSGMPESSSAGLLVCGLFALVGFTFIQSRFAQS